MIELGKEVQCLPKAMVQIGQTEVLACVYFQHLHSFTCLGSSEEYFLCTYSLRAKIMAQSFQYSSLSKGLCEIPAYSWVAGFNSFPSHENQRTPLYPLATTKPVFPVPWWFTLLPSATSIGPVWHVVSSSARLWEHVTDKVLSVLSY
jgi:hypothetical protein